MLWPLLGILLATPALSGATNVRVRWLPSPSSGVTGYRIWTRLPTGGYGAPVDAGLPAPAADGSIAAVLSNVDASTSHVFAVTAYAKGEPESAMSNEVTLAVKGGATTTTLPAATTTTTTLAGSTTTTTVPPACATEDDCPAVDACHVAHCRLGLCTTDAVVCPDGGACAPATCDPQTGCGVQQLADGSDCDAGDPCIPGTCSTGTCVPPPPSGARGVGSHYLSVSKLVLASAGRARRMHGGGSFAAAPVDPTVSGGTIELRAGDGAVLYRASLPPTAFRANRSHTAFRLIPSVAHGVAGGVTKFLVRRRGDTTDVATVGTTPSLELAAAQRSLTWALRFGAECVRTPDLACTERHPSTTSCDP